MKKYLFALLLISFCTTANAQDYPEYQEPEPPKPAPRVPVMLAIDSTTKLVTYQGVVQVDSSLSTEELYQRAKEWFVLTFDNPSDFIQLENYTQMRFIAKGGVLIRTTNYSKGGEDMGHVRFTLIMQFKKGRYRYEFSRMYHEGINDWPAGGTLEKSDPDWHLDTNNFLMWDLLKKNTDFKMKALILSLNVAMTKGIIKSDW